MIVTKELIKINFFNCYKNENNHNTNYYVSLKLYNIDRV